MSAKPSKIKIPKECIVKMRNRLIEAARVEFSEKGIECATTRGIAERAECNEVTLFRHFESKQKLLASVVEGTSSEFRTVCESPGEMTGNLRKDLERFATAYNNSLERCEGMARALIGESRRQPDLAKELIGNVLDPFHQSIACYLKGQIELGHVRSGLKVLAVAELFTATLMSGMLRRTSGLSKLKSSGWVRETVDLFARGIEVAK